MSHLDELLSVYLDGETTTAETERVVRHLDDCLRCRRRMAGLQETRAGVRSLPQLALPPDLVPVQTSPTVRKPVWLGAAAAVVAAVVAFAALLAGTGPEPVDVSDLTRQVGARASLDPGSGSVKLVLPGGLTE